MTDPFAFLTFEGMTKMFFPDRKSRPYRLFEFVENCRLCKEAPAEVGGLCISCDHLQDDVRIDEVATTPLKL